MERGGEREREREREIERDREREREEIARILQLKWTQLLHPS